MLVGGLSMKVNEMPRKISLYTWYSELIIELEALTQIPERALLNFPYSNGDAGLDHEDKATSAFYMETWSRRRRLQDERWIHGCKARQTA